MAAGGELFPPDVKEEFRSCEADYLNVSGTESQMLLEPDFCSTMKERVMNLLR